MTHPLLKIALSFVTLVGFMYGTTATADALPDMQHELADSIKFAGEEYLKPRPMNAIPDNEFGAKVRKGYQLFVNSQSMRGEYVGNNLSCVNCHMDKGKRPYTAPMWSAFMAYPAYRKKNDKVNTYEERIQGCFTYSMNGNAPPNGSPELVALSAYSYWLAMGGLLDMYGMKDTPVPELSDAEMLLGGKHEDFKLPEKIAADWPVDKRNSLPGRGYAKLDKPAKTPDISRGEVVFENHCVACHGTDGQGQEVHGEFIMPPLWGPKSFNWGAGMHRINTAAYFIYEAMPYGKGIQLAPQDAWDVAAFINSHERPQDPRNKGDLKATTDKYHQHQGYYGRSPGGDALLGTKSYPNNPQ